VIYYRAQLDRLKDQSEKENLGMAFVSFKNKDCVLDTIEQLDIIKNRLVGKQYNDLVGL
jgi:hypothetical protein